MSDGALLLCVLAGLVVCFGVWLIRVGDAVAKSIGDQSRNLDERR